MSFLSLQDQLRDHIRSRIRRKELTGSGLARAAGFPQGHLSNFLNFRRGLSLESMDRLLQTLGIGVIDLIALHDIQQHAVPYQSDQNVEQVPLVSSNNAARARFSPDDIVETRGFNRSFLRRLKPSEPHHRGDWRRFILLKLDTATARDLFSADVAGAILLVDRHYNSLRPYRRMHPNLYVVNFDGMCLAGYLERVENSLVLRSPDTHRPLRSLPVASGRGPEQNILGRICHVGLEL